MKTGYLGVSHKAKYNFNVKDLEKIIWALDTTKLFSSKKVLHKQRIMPMSWDMHEKRNPDSLSKLFELTVNQRNDGDLWLNATLEADRKGDNT